MDRTAILVIDDDVTMAESLVGALEDDFEVCTALDGREGLERIKDREFSLVLLDLKMPGMNGVEVLERIRDEKKDLPVIIITGKGSYEEAKSCANLNVQGFIEKPYDIEELVRKIDKYYIKDKNDYLEILNLIAGVDSIQTTLSPLIRNILNYIMLNYDKDITREQIADLLALSPDYISRKFRQECQCTLKEFIIGYRIYRSMDLITNTSMKIKDIASKVGISDVNYFCRIFKKQTGFTPESLRK